MILDPLGRLGEHDRGVSELIMTLIDTGEFAWFGWFARLISLTGLDVAIAHGDLVTF